MEITANDVKVLGRVAAITTDGIVASAEQVYDDLHKDGMFQNAINAEVKAWIDAVEPISNSDIDQIFV